MLVSVAAEFGFLTQGLRCEGKAVNGCRGLDGRKAGSKLFRAGRTNYIMGGVGGPGHTAGGKAPEGSCFSSLGQIFCDRERHT